jgi:hypothetical protein
VSFRPQAEAKDTKSLPTRANMGKLTILRGDDLVDGYAAVCEQLRRIVKEVS